MTEHTCPNCERKSSILYGSKVFCPCGTLSDLSGKIVATAGHKSPKFDPPDGAQMTMKPLENLIKGN